MHASVHGGNWNLVTHGDLFSERPDHPPTLELYDLVADVKESRDLAAEYPDRVETLHRQLQVFGPWQKPGVTPYGQGRAGFQAPEDWNILRP